MKIREEIIEYIKKNRVSTTEVADALGKEGAIPNVYPVTQGIHVVGKIKWVYACNESNWSLHDQIQSIEENCIVLVDNIDCNERAIFGELVSKYLFLYRQCKAIVVRGRVRDAAALNREKWPIWCEGFNPVGCLNEKPVKKPSKTIIEKSKYEYDEGIAICDDCGVVVIPFHKITEGLLKRIKEVEKQEDIWFNRLDYYKENTYEIVCEKRYLDNDDYIKCFDIEVGKI